MKRRLLRGFVARATTSTSASAAVPSRALFLPLASSIEVARRSITFAAGAEKIPRSGIRDVMDATWALEKKLGEGERLIKLEVGQPDFPPPSEVIKATCESLKAGQTAYIPNTGLDELRDAVARHHQNLLGVNLSKDEVVITQGAIGAISTLFQSFIEKGDEVLLPDPTWVNYSMAAGVCGGSVSTYALDPSLGWKPCLEEIERKISERTKCIVLCSPSNPTGSVLTLTELEEIVDVANKYGIAVISDEIYGQIFFGEGNSAPSLLQCSNLNPQTAAVVGGISKAWAMTGFRVGWIISKNKALVGMSSKLLECSISCGVPFAQAGAAEALLSREVEGQVKGMVEEYRRRRDAAIRVLKKYDMFEYEPEGAFYLLVKVGDRDKDFDSTKFCFELLHAQHVAVSPGCAFGENASDYVRVSLASPIGDIEDGMARLCDFLGR